MKYKIEQNALDDYTRWLWDRQMEATNEEIGEFFVQHGTDHQFIKELVSAGKITIRVTLSELLRNNK